LRLKKQRKCEREKILLKAFYIEWTNAQGTAKKSSQKKKEA
jgi:hypothetical protein